jgi:hypothetical protein
MCTLTAIALTGLELLRTEAANNLAVLVRLLGRRVVCRLPKDDRKTRDGEHMVTGEGW